jgi:hypothetical protein
MHLDVVTVVVLALALTTYGGAVLLTWLSRQEIRKVLDEQAERRKKQHETLVDELIGKIRPRVVHCSKPDEVTREAVELIRAAVDAKKQYEAKMRETKSEAKPARALRTGGDIETAAGGAAGETEIHDTGFITFYGAADLAGERPDNDLAEDYRRALSAAADQRIRLRRYISFFDDGDLAKRSTEQVVKYLRWLARQHETLANNAGFILAHNARVPQWGANSATLLTYSAVMEIKGNGAAAVAIHDHPIAATVRQSLQEAREEAAESNKDEYLGDVESLARLAEHIKERCEKRGISLDEVAKGTHFLRTYYMSRRYLAHDV